MSKDVENNLTLEDKEFEEELANMLPLLPENKENLKKFININVKFQISSKDFVVGAKSKAPIREELLIGGSFNFIKKIIQNLDNKGIDQIKQLGSVIKDDLGIENKFLNEIIECIEGLYENNKNIASEFKGSYECGMLEEKSERIIYNNHEAGKKIRGIIKSYNSDKGSSLTGVKVSKTINSDVKQSYG